MTVFFLLPFAILYLSLIIYFTVGNLSYRPKKSEMPQLKASLVIPFRNEALNLPRLLAALNALDFPKNQLEIIFVDDFSEDNGSELISGNIDNFQWRLIQLKCGKGKKAALKAGITAAQHEIIVSTDADCVMQSKWLKSMLGYFEAENPQLLLGPVVFNSEPSVFKSLQQLEFAALMATTQGAVAQQKPFMSNGANLVFRKEMYLQLTAAELALNQASGDDVFLLHAIKSRYQKLANICFANDQDAVVTAYPVGTLSAFIQQRLRWGGKAKHYTDRFTIYVSIVVFFGNVILPIILLLALLGVFNWIYFVTYFLLKWTVDSWLLGSVSKWRGFAINPLYTILLTFIYPLYFILLALLSLRFKPQWKGRKI